MIYDYQCLGCNHVFSKKLPISDYKKPCGEPCPECGENRVERKIGAASFSANPNLKDKRPDGWKDVLSRAHKYAGRHSTVDV